MKKYILIFLIAFSAFSTARAQLANYNSFYFHVGKQLADMDDFNIAIDTVNKHNILDGAYEKKLFSHFTYGFGYLGRRKVVEFGGNLFWGNTNEIFLSGFDPVDSTQRYQWWIRQRLFGLNGRIGLSGKYVAIGTDLGGFISNFQHLKLKESKTPLWFINFTGERSYVGSLSPYLAAVLPIGDAGMVRIEAYTTFTFGKTSYAGVFDKASFFPDTSIKEDMIMRFYGIRMTFGVANYL